MTKQELIKNILSGERAISSSALKTGKTSTKEFLDYYLGEKKESKAFDFGNAFELFLIDEVGFYSKVAVMDESQRPEPSKDYKTKVNQEWKAEFYAKNADKYIIAATGKESFETIKELRNLAQEHPMYDALINGDYQLAFTWNCPVTGLKRYSRPDVVHKDLGVIIDIKTDASDDFQRSALNNDYFLQALDQIQGAIANGIDVKEYYWAVFEKSGTLHCTFYKLSLDDLLPVETVQEVTLRRIKSDLESGENIVWRDMPIKNIKVPTYYAKGY